MKDLSSSNKSRERQQGVPTGTTTLPGVNKQARGPGRGPGLRLD